MIAIPYMMSVGVVSYFLHFLARRSAKRGILNVLGDRRVRFLAFLGTTVEKIGDFKTKDFLKKEVSEVFIFRCHICEATLHIHSFCQRVRQFRFSSNRLFNDLAKLSCVSRRKPESI